MAVDTSIYIQSLQQSIMGESQATRPRPRVQRGVLECLEKKKSGKRKRIKKTTKRKPSVNGAAFSLGCCQDFVCHAERL